MAKILEGILVVDFSRYAAGPYCSALLGDMGAEVIRIERPGGGEDRFLGPFIPGGHGIMSQIVLRNKKGITLDLHHPKAPEIIKTLVERADIVLHNFAPGSKEGELLKYEVLKRINPKIILLAVSAFGHTGPYAKRVGFDTIGQAASGTMSISGFPHNPPTKAGVPYVDFSSATTAALGAVLALYHREKVGKGQMVDVSLMDVAVSFTGALGVFTEYKHLGTARPQPGNEAYNTFGNCYETKDGWIYMMAIGNNLWHRILKVIGREDLAEDPRLKDDWARARNYDVINPIIDQWMKEKTSDEVVRIMEKARVPCSPVYSLPEVIENPQVKAREMLVEVEHPDVGKFLMSGTPIKFSETPGGVRCRAPFIGEHNKEIYCGLLNFSEEEFIKLKEEGVI